MSAAIQELLESLSLESNERIELPQLEGVAPLCAIAMPEERSFDRWQEANAKASEFGYVAIGIGSKHSLDRLIDHVECVDWWNLSQATEVATSLDLQKWFAERESDIVEDAGELPWGEWNDSEEGPRNGLWFPFENGVHLDPWWMGMIPAQENWQVPLSLAYGNWNACPDATVHAAVARYWQEVYGATLVGMGPDTIEFLVDDPPSTRETALALAKQQFLYCSDIVDQGIGTISALGASLIDNGTWNFWWD